MSKTAIIGGGAVILVAAIVLFSGTAKDTANQLRPQAVRNINQAIDTPPQLPEKMPAVEADIEIEKIQTEEPLQEPDVAGAVKQRIIKELTDNEVNVSIDQKIKSTDPVKSKVEININTDQDPQVEIITEPEPAICFSDQYNCSDFTTCDEVISIFTQCAGDPHNLDNNSDGIPCDTLCS